MPSFIEKLEKSSPIITLVASAFTIIQSFIVFFTPFILVDSNKDNPIVIITIISINIVNILLILYLGVYIKIKQSLEDSISVERGKFETLISEKNSLVQTLTIDLVSVKKSTQRMSEVLSSMEVAAADLHEYIYNHVNANNSDGKTASDLKCQSDKFILFLLANIKEFFDQYSGYECAVYIAIIDPDQNEPENSQVWPFYRDPVSYIKRKSIDQKQPLYGIKEFYPLRELCLGRVFDDIFSCDDCRKIEAYRDRIDHWSKFYTACLAAPIGSLNGGRTLHKITGFLVVDNLGGNLDNVVCKSAINSFASMLFSLSLYMRDLGLLQPHNNN